MRRLSRCAVLASVALLAVACSTVPSGERMKVDDYFAPAPHADTLGLQVHGGWTLQGQITKEEFAKAVEASLIASRTFSRLVRVEDATYRLDAVVGDVRQPAAGLNMTTEMTVLWSLSRVDTKETVWQDLIASTHTATAGQAFAGAVRARKSTEGAARKNIRQALERLADADL